MIQAKYKVTNTNKIHSPLPGLLIKQVKQFPWSNYEIETFILLYIYSSGNTEKYLLYGIFN